MEYRRSREEPEVIKKLQLPKTQTNFQFFLGLAQSFAKITKHLSKQTDELKKLLRK